MKYNTRRIKHHKHKVTNVTLITFYHVRYLVNSGHYKYKKKIYKIYEDEVVVVEGLSQALTTEKPLGGVGVDYLICCFCI